MKFSEMNLSEKTLKGLEKMNFVEATQIQESVIPYGLQNRDILGQAQTGTGKTAAFGICILEKTDWENTNLGIQHLILAPTRELATQIANEINQLARFYFLKIGVIIGGESYGLQEKMLKNHPQIIVSTPGRLLDYIEKGKIDFKSLKTFTLDEVDEMLNVGFYEDIVKIIKILPANINKYMFTATTNDRTDKIAKQLLSNPFIVKVSSGYESKKNIKQLAIIVKESEKFDVLVNQILHHNDKQAIVFCRTKIRVRHVCMSLRTMGIKADMLQGDMSQQARSKALQNFKDKSDQVLVATDVAARGIDVPGIEFVYNYDLPENDEYYVHRIGRTGRAGLDGTSYSLIKNSEIDDIRRLNKMTKSNIEIIKQEPSDGNLKDKIIINAINNKLAKVNLTKVNSSLIDELKKTTTHEQLIKLVIAMVGNINNGSNEEHQEKKRSQNKFHNHSSHREGFSGGRNNFHKRAHNDEHRSDGFKHSFHKNDSLHNNNEGLSDFKQAFADNYSSFNKHDSHQNTNTLNFKRDGKRNFKAKRKTKPW